MDDDFIIQNRKGIFAKSGKLLVYEELFYNLKYCA